MKNLRILNLFLVATLLVSCNSGSNHKIDNRTACGAIGLDNYEKIINGDECNDIKSSVVRIRIGTEGKHIMCSGVIISENVVLTAGHCLNRNYDDIVVKQGENFYQAEFGVVNPYYYESMVFFFHGLHTPGDIAIIKIKDRFNVKPLPIIVSKIPQKREKILVAGYGVTESGIKPDHVNAAFMQVSESANLGFIMEYDNTNTNVCSGDSGGPALALTKYGPAIYGTTSGGKSKAECREGDIAFFTNLSLKQNLDFIKRYASVSTL